MSVSQEAFAQESETVRQKTLQPEEQTALQNFARQFLRNVERKFAKIEKDLNPPDPMASIPDGERLIFGFRILDDKERVFIEGDAITLKKERELFISFRDFLGVMLFPIRFDPDTKNATGWYIKKTFDFSLNWSERRIISNGVSFTIPESTIEEEDDLLVSLPVLVAWFNLTLEPDVSNLLIDITSEERLPLISRLQRRDRVLRTQTISEAELPLIEDPYQIAEVPVADVTLGWRYRRPGEIDGNRGETTRVANATVQLAGDVAGHSGRLFATADSEEQLRNVRFNLSKDEEDPTLLGPLQARRYEIGDISQTLVPVFSNSGQELGARVTNRKTGSATSFTQTNFSGDLPPDWDVELYRNNQLIEFLTVGEDGRYEFNDVILFEGDNDFRFVFYGPQGEIREETQSIPVSVSDLQNAGVYDVSISAQNETLYRSPDFESPEDGDISIAATYERPLGDGFSGIAGFKQRTYGEDQKTQFMAGVSKNFDGTIVNANIGGDTTGEAVLETAARRKFGEHDVRVGATFATDRFSTTQDTENANVLNLSANARGPLFKIGDYPVDYSFDTRYLEDSLGISDFQITNNLNANFKPIRVNHSLLYRDRSDTEEGEELRGGLAVSGSALGTSWRALANYTVKPESEIDSTFLRVSRAITPDIRGAYEFEYRPDPSYTQNTLEANIQTDKFTVTPRISLDSDDELQATLTTRFGLMRDPGSGSVTMSRDRFANTGAVSAFVFLDKDGDLQFGENDEPIPEARVDSIQTRRYGLTDEGGRTLVKGLQQYRTTDIRLDQSTLADPFWIPATQGNAIRPRPGHVVEMEFPVHISGELDGTIRATRRGRVEGVRNMNVILYDMEGRKVQTTQTAFDGFYLFSLIPPGEYYLSFERKDLESLNLLAPAPEKITIGYDGTIIYAKDFKLSSVRQGGGALQVVSGYKDFALRNAHTPFPSLRENAVVLNLGEYRSSLLMATTWFSLRARLPGLFGNEYALIKPSESLPDVKTNKHTLRLHDPTMTIESAYQKCKSITARGFVCNVEFLPGGFTAQDI